MSTLIAIISIISVLSGVTAVVVRGNDRIPIRVFNGILIVYLISTGFIFFVSLLTVCGYRGLL